MDKVLNRAQSPSLFPNVGSIDERNDTNRFLANKMDENEVAAMPEIASNTTSLLLPVSIFDDPQLKPILKTYKTENVYPDDRISYDELKCDYKNVAPSACLTLYQDDAGNVDSVKGVLMKTMEHGDTDNTGTSRKKANLGTVFGVFLPCCQNIVGVIYFVRFPWIVGCAGIMEAGLIAFLCNMMSVCTAVSMSAIATNGKVTAGGTYFMISRSLGPTFGGSVGFLFFMGTSVSVAMYYLGTVEILLTYIAPDMAVFSKNPLDPMRYNDYRLIGSIQLLCMVTIVFIGVKCVSRFSCFAIMFLVTAICSIILGAIVATPDRSVKLCALGNRLIRYSVAFANNTWQCHKNSSGPIYKSYCQDINGTDVCDDYFLNNEPKLIPGVPGFTIKDLLGNIPGTNVKASVHREIVTDISTSFVVLFAIYFPSITGVESGSNYSGDLRDAQVSIPRGTMWAAAVTSTLYLGSVVVLGSSVEGMLLRDKYGESLAQPGDLVLSRVSWPSKWLVLVGTLTATIGAGLQALAGAPRLLQAIAEDNIIPHLGLFAKKWRGEPIRGLALTYVIAEIGILIAFLDYVAPIVTMFFLMCYGFINFAVTLQSLLDTPHWRPSFKCYHWSLTLFGTALCLVTMFVCNWVYALIAITLAILLYQYIEYKGAEKEWGDGITGLSMSGALYALGRMKQDFKHTKNWSNGAIFLVIPDLNVDKVEFLVLSETDGKRPQILVLLKMQVIEDNVNKFNSDDFDLVMLSSMMKEGKGLTMFATVIKGLLADNIEDKERLKQIYVSCLENAGVKGFIEIIVAPSIVDGLSCLVQSAGLGALRPNTIIMGWPYDGTDNRNSTSLYIFLETMRNIALARYAAIVLKAKTFPSKNTRLFGTIDIWWIVNDGGMLLLLGHLLRRSRTWSKCKLRLFTVAMENDNTVQIKEDLQTYLYQLRIEGTVEVVQMAGENMSAYVYERTLKMEERTRQINELSIKDMRRLSIPPTKKAVGKEVQQVFEKARSVIEVTPKTTNKYDFSTSIDNRYAFQPTEENIRHMNTAVRLNAKMLELSNTASLVILNLPCVPESIKGQANYMSFLEVLTEGLDRLLLVRGTGSEVITVYN